MHSLEMRLGGGELCTCQGSRHGIDHHIPVFRTDELLYFQDEAVSIPSVDFLIHAPYTYNGLLILLQRSQLLGVAVKVSSHAVPAPPLGKNSSHCKRTHSSADLVACRP